MVKKVIISDLFISMYAHAANGGAMWIGLEDIQDRISRALAHDTMLRTNSLLRFLVPLHVCVHLDFLFIYSLFILL
jgi:hypothetical protein